MLTVRVFRKGASILDVPVKMMTFPGGELHVTAEIVCFRSEVESVKIVANLETASDIMALLLLTDAIRRQVSAPIHLFMPYVPYARQDRVANPGEALSIKVFCDLINAQRYESVFIKDPHSDVTPALLERCTTIDPMSDIYRAVEGIGGDCLLVCPDAGARKRVHAVAKRLQLDVLHADKVRNTKTGEITGTMVEMRVVKHDKPLLVIDDICDGGRTFIELAKELRQVGYAGPLYLYVTHGIFSKGVEPLMAHYDRIYTTRDWTASNLRPRVIELN